MWTLFTDRGRLGAPPHCSLHWCCHCASKGGLDWKAPAKAAPANMSNKRRWCCAAMTPFIFRQSPMTPRWKRSPSRPWRNMPCRHEWLAINVGLIYMEQEDTQSTAGLRTIPGHQRCKPLCPQWPWPGVGTGKFDDARIHYERALVLDPKHARAHFNMAVLPSSAGPESALSISRPTRIYRNSPMRTSPTGLWTCNARRRSARATSDNQDVEQEWRTELMRLLLVMAALACACQPG